MYQFFVEPSQIQGNRIVITGSDVNHIKNVLRMKPGEEIAVSNGTDGKEYRCGIEELLEEEIICTLRFIKEDGLELPARVTFFQGLPKADNIALVAERNGLRRPLYIGDTQGDYDAASKAGVPFLHAAYGFGRIDRPVPSVATFGDLPDAIRRLTPP